MKTLKSYILGLATLAALTVGFTACQDDVDAPGVDIPEAASVPNTTLLELKELYWNEATNYADTIGVREDGSHYVIHGRVISSDEEGNVFKSLVIQDETAALAFSIDTYNLYLDYRVGQEIVLDVTGMYIGKYAGLQQMGRPSWYENGSSWQVSFMSLEYFQNHVELNGLPQAALVDTLVVNSFSEISTTPEGLRKWQSQLVRFQNVSFTEGGERTFSVYHTSSNDEQNTTIVDRNGSTLTVRTSGYCTFFNQLLPVGNIDLVGILSYYNTAWQIILIDGDGVIEVGERPGAKENPYTVEQAIDEQAKGLTASGWVKGYIVGAVAPEVEDVASNDDIQWEAPTILANSLVIAPEPTVQDYSKCLVVMLTSGSAFQQVGNLRDNPANLGKEIMVNGSFGEVLGTYGITGNTGTTDSFQIEGVEAAGSEFPEGDGQEATPYNVAQIVAMNPSSTTAAVESGVWVKGYIVGSMPTGGSSTTLSGTNFNTDDAATTNLVLGPTPDCTDPSRCVGIQLPTSMRSELALANQPGNLGKPLAVKGDIMKYCGGPGVKNLTEKVFDGSSSGDDTPVTPPTETGDVPNGAGTAASPYNCAQLIALNPTSTTEAVASGISIKGYIVGSMPTGGSSTTLSGTNFSTADAATTNLVLAPTANCTDPSVCVGVQLPTGSVRTALNLSANPGNLGKLVTLTGDVMKYCGAPGLKNTSAYVFEGDSPVTPPSTTVTPTGAGTAENPYNVAKALEVIAAGPATTDVYVKGKISSIKEIAPSFGNATYYIVDEGSSQELGVYRGYWINGDKFTSEDQLAVGAEVVVTGVLVNYMGNTPQFTTGNHVYSYNGSTSGGDTPVTPPTEPTDPVDPADPSGETVTIAATALTIPGDTTADGFTVTIDQNGGATAPTLHESSSTARLYADNTLKISSTSKIAKVVFELNSSTNAARYTTFTPSAGKLDPAQETGDTSITWVGDADSVTFTVGHDATLGSDGASKRGQIHVKSIVIYPAK